MDNESGGGRESGRHISDGVSDDFLLEAVIGGDDVALRRLIDRYDRLVRYTIFRASRKQSVSDPHWLDSLASTTWSGFVQSMRRASGNRPAALRAYLVRIARNQVASAARKAAPLDQPSSPALESAAATLDDSSSDPQQVVQNLELVEIVRDCLLELDEGDRSLASQLGAITERRWRDAAMALEMSESTLRSRWKRVLERLRACVERKTGVPVAPTYGGDDH